MSRCRVGDELNSWETARSSYESGQPRLPGPGLPWLTCCALPIPARLTDRYSSSNFCKVQINAINYGDSCGCNQSDIEFDVKFNERLAACQFIRGELSLSLGRSMASVWAPDVMRTIVAGYPTLPPLARWSDQANNVSASQHSVTSSLSWVRDKLDTSQDRSPISRAQVANLDTTTGRPWLFPDTRR